MEATAGSLGFLRRFARAQAATEFCELCGAPLAEEHAHLVEPARRGLVCACEACAILFGHPGAARYRRVPRRLEALGAAGLTDLEWASLGLPVHLAFLLDSTPAGQVVAVYPSPGGPLEAPVPNAVWAELVADRPALANFEPDVEALLVNRVDDARECYRVGIDVCYRLIGLLRTHWQGFSGGQALWTAIGRFFTELRARTAGGEHG